MNRIPANVVEETYEKTLKMSEQEAFKLSYTWQKEQPLLVAYLAAIDEGILNQSERELLFYLGTIVWQIMSASPQTLPKITEEDLLRIEKENFNLAESFRKADTVTFAEVVKKILPTYGQPEVFRYVVAALMEDDNEDIRDENLGIIILDLKTIIDCLNQ